MLKQKKCLLQFIRLIILISAVSIHLSLYGCQKTPEPSPKEADYLLKVNESTITVKDFNRALEIAKTAYPYEVLNNADDDAYKTVQLKIMKIELLRQLIERLILLERARELNLTISADELAQAVSAYKAGYPDGTFDQLLIEYAISYSAWESELKIRLLIDKLIEAEVGRHIAITPEEAAQYQQLHPADQTADESVSNKTDQLNIAQLKRIKTEVAYQSWIEGLKQRYPISINHETWKEFTDS